MTELPDVCPKCEKPFNHLVTNGYRNRWIGSANDFAVCTTADSERMYVHTD